MSQLANESSKFILPRPDMASMLIENSEKQQLINTYFSRIFHAPHRLWYDLYTPLEVNGIFLGNGGFVLSAITFREISAERCRLTTITDIYHLVEEKLQQALNHLCINYVAEVDGLIVTIAVFSRSDEKSIRENGPLLVEGIRAETDTATRQLWDDYGIKIRSFIGNATYGIDSLPDAYTKVYNFWMFDEFMKDYPLQESSIYHSDARIIRLDYIRQQSDRLFDLINGNQYDAVLTLFDTVLDDITAIEPHMLHLMQAHLLSFILAFTDKLIGNNIFTEQEVPVDDMINLLHRSANYPELRDSLHNMMEQLVALRIRQQKVNINVQISRIKSYIDSNYADTELSALRLSEQFGISQSHLSTTFHTQTGIRLIDYIHSVRINHAIELLKSTDQPIDEICAAVGYGSVSTLFRAFQKYRNINPSYYRRKR